MKTSKNYRLSDWSLHNLEYLRDIHTNLNDTEIIEFSLSLAAVVTSHLTVKGSTFELNNDMHTLMLKRILDHYTDLLEL